MRVIYSIAATTVGEAIRRKVLLIILFIGVLFVAIAPGLQVLSARQEEAVLKGLTLGIIQLTSVVIAIVLTVYLIPNEIERRTIYTILSKPVLRAQFLLGKYLGAVAALALMMSLMTSVLLVVYAVQNRGGNMSALADLAKPPMMYFVQMSLLAALAICLSTFVTPLVNFFLSGGLYLIGSLLSTVFQTMNENPNMPAFTKYFALIVSSILPNFAKFNVQNPIINPVSQIQNETQYYLAATGYGVIYIGVLLIIGMLIFEQREV
ncbi:MAG: ABC transporter permease [Chthonomonas sp.]|nr:ABC transporter permease [Chthonomonas sp.]